MWIIYNFGLRVYAAAIALASLWNPKARQWRNGRKQLLERMAAAIPPHERVVWFHVASLGEFEQGRPLMEQLRAEHPEYKILLTFFSPSGYEIRKNYTGADYIFYLPLDLPRQARRFLDIVHPEAAVFIKYEYWLNLLRELRERRIRTFVVSAIFRRDSVFFKWYGGLWRKALQSFERLFVQNETSKELLAELGIDGAVVAGDTRFDRVAAIAAAARRIDLVERFKADRRLFVAGSTWEPDEELLLDLMHRNPGIRFVIAPHELEQERIDRLMARAEGGAVRYTQAENDPQLADRQLLVIDTIGLLSSVYRYAEWAYIGGGFGVGIHNTLEAATFGLPIAFGPRYEKFKEARDLIAEGAAVSVGSAEALAAWFAPLRDDESLRQQRARIAKRYVASHCGATQLILDTIFGQ